MAHSAACGAGRHQQGGEHQQQHRQASTPHQAPRGEPGRGLVQPTGGEDRDDHHADRNGLQHRAARSRQSRPLHATAKKNNPGNHGRGKVHQKKDDQTGLLVSSEG